MNKTIEYIIKEELRKITENVYIDNSKSDKNNICDHGFINTTKELNDLLSKTKIKKSDLDKINKIKKDLKKSNQTLSNDKDNFDTNLHKISSILCK